MNWFYDPIIVSTRRHSYHPKMGDLNCHPLPGQGFAMWRGKQSKGILQFSLQERNPTLPNEHHRNCLYLRRAASSDFSIDNNHSFTQTLYPLTPNLKLHDFDSGWQLFYNLWTPRPHWPLMGLLFWTCKSLKASLLDFGGFDFVYVCILCVCVCACARVSCMCSYSHSPATYLCASQSSQWICNPPLCVFVSVWLKTGYLHEEKVFTSPIYDGLWYSANSYLMWNFMWVHLCTERLSCSQQWCWMSKGINPMFAFLVCGFIIVWDTRVMFYVGWF